jgi:multicomponent Na+:H+ antiporter subunit E
VAGGWRAALLRALVLAASWWIVSEGAAALTFAIASVALALLASLALPTGRPPHWRPLALLRLAGLFVIESIHGGLDISRRALAPRLPISPDVIAYAARLPEGPARNFFLGTISLMPGTLCVGAENGELKIHLLAKRSLIDAELDRVERAIARATGTPLEGSDG